MLLDTINKVNYAKKKHTFKDKTVTDAIKLLTDYKFKGKDTLFESELDDASWYEKITGYSFKMYFHHQHFAQDLGFTNGSIKQQLVGSLTVTIRGHEKYDVYNVELNCPSLNIASNYDTFFREVIRNRYQNEDIPMWGSRAMYPAEQRITKQFKTINGLSKGIDDLLNFAYKLIQDGLDWSNSDRIKAQVDFEYSLQSKIFKLKEEQEKLQKQIDKIQTNYNSYHEKCLVSFKQVKNTLKDFI